MLSRNWYEYQNKKVRIILNNGAEKVGRVGIVSDEGDDEPESQFIGLINLREAYLFKEIKSIKILED